MTKEEEILQAAEEEFFRNGYDSTSTATIAKNAGVTHAMVNYYFRNKEQLFTKVLDNHVKDLLQRLKPLMKENGSFVEIVEETAAAIFDSFCDDRRFPFLILDIARTHPEFLAGHREAVNTVCSDSIRHHGEMLSDQIDAGAVAPCTMNDIYDTVVSLAMAPFLNLPLLVNVAGFTPDHVESYLAAHRTEMLKVIRARYSRK